MLKNKKLIGAMLLGISLVLALVVWVSYHFISRPARPETNLTGRRPERAVEITGSQSKVGEIFALKINPQGGNEGKEVKVLVDGKEAGNCLAGADVCEIALNPFTRNDVGEHSYQVYFGGKRDETESQSGSFVVVDDSASGGSSVSPVTMVEASIPPSAATPAPAEPAAPGQAAPAPAPQSDVQNQNQTQTDLPSPKYEKLITSGSQAAAGDLFSATIYAKNIPPISRIDVYWNNQAGPTKSCVGVLICNAVFGPAEDAQIGKKIDFNFVLVGVNGKTLKVSSYYYVTAPQAAPPAPASPSVPATPPLPVEPVNNPTITQPPSVQQPDDSQPLEKYVEPIITISASYNQINPEDTVEFIAILNPGSETVDYINILVNQKLAKTCGNVLTCSFTGGPYLDYAGKTVNYAATAYFTDGATKTTGNAGLTVLPAKVITVSAAKDYVEEWEINILTATFSPMTSLSVLNIYADDKLVKSCYNPTCSVTVGPFSGMGGSYVNYYSYWSVAGSYLKSEVKKFYVMHYVAPTVDISLSPEKRNYAHSDSLTFTATAHAGEETFDNLKIYLNGSVVKTCLDIAHCSYTTTPQQILGGVPSQTTNITYNARGVFSGGAKIVSTENSSFSVLGVQ